MLRAFLTKYDVGGVFITCHLFVAEGASEFGMNTSLWGDVALRSWNKDKINLASLKSRHIVRRHVIETHIVIGFVCVGSDCDRNGDVVLHKRSSLLL